MLGPVQCGIFINDLDDWTECTLSKFADDTQLEGVADTPEGHAATDKLKKWADRNLMVFNKGNCKIMHLGKSNPIEQYIVEGNRMEISFFKKCP